ncbi:MAG: hypothetical protein M1812_000469 [Candelaria pacifica]|nr:MAG: hypothetical protein M1812_000469 [Candelaria pacifica]
MGWFSPNSPRRSSYSRSSSYYKRRSRDGYITRMLHQLKRIFRDLMNYARRHPVKVFMLVIMPLITGGAAASLLKMFGIRLPGGLAGLMGAGRGHESGYSSYSRGASSDMFGGGNLGSMLRVAQMFV